MSSIYLLEFPENFKPEGEMKKIKTFEDVEVKEDDIFMAYGFTSPLAVRLKYYQIPYENLVIVTASKKDLEELIKKEKINFRNDYSIFSGAKINTTNVDIKKDILISMKLLSEIAYDMLDAGYLVEENRKKIKDWIISFEEPILKIFSEYHKITTTNDSMSIEDEFMVNPQFRRMILVMILKILANFIVNNKLISIKEVSDIGNWLEEDTWKELKTKVKLF